MDLILILLIVLIILAAGGAYAVNALLWILVAFLVLALFFDFRRGRRPPP